jgi:predicted AAA+ superfamily ATPase
MYHQRHASERLLKLVAAFPVVVVSGARQVGKTTLLRHLLAAWGYVEFDPVQDTGGARSDPDLFLRAYPCPLLLDEIQYAPELVPAIKRYVDSSAGANGLFVLTGSQQWQVLRHVAESLAGRAVFLDLDGFSLAETANASAVSGWLAGWLASPQDFAARAHRRLELAADLHETLWRGSLPRATQLPLELLPDFWNGYVRTYIERDARLLADVVDWQQFGLFFRLVCALTGQEINHSQLGRDIGMTPQTARRWLHILQGTFQWYEHPAFGTNLVKRVSGKPKGYVADTGLACHAMRIPSPEALAGHPAFGPLFETAVAGEIRKQASCLAGAAVCHHWRAAGGAEVDFVIEYGGRLYPVEVKAASTLARRDATSLRAFAKAYPDTAAATGLVLAPINHPQWLSEQAYAIPWDVAE